MEGRNTPPAAGRLSRRRSRGDLSSTADDDLNLDADFLNNRVTVDAQVHQNPYFADLEPVFGRIQPVTGGNLQQPLAADAQNMIRSVVGSPHLLRPGSNSPNRVQSAAGSPGRVNSPPTTVQPPTPPVPPPVPTIGRFLQSKNNQ